MAFSIAVWRKYYDQINALGSVVRQNIHDYHDTGHCDLPKDKIDAMLKDADEICKTSAAYMTKNGIYPSSVKWIYNIKDTTTHCSSPDFVYAHLMVG